MFQIVAPKIGGALAGDGTKVVADHMIHGGPSVLFDAVVVAPGAAAIPELLATAPAIDWVADAFAHCKVIGTVGAAGPLLAKAGVETDDGVIEITAKTIGAFIERAKQGRVWEREVKVSGPDRANRRPVKAKGTPSKPAAATRRR